MILPMTVKFPSSVNQIPFLGLELVSFGGDGWCTSVNENESETGSQNGSGNESENNNNDGDDSAENVSLYEIDDRQMLKEIDGFDNGNHNNCEDDIHVVTMIVLFVRSL